MTALALAGWISLALILLFVAAYVFARRIDNYSIVDVVWAYSFTGVAGFLALAGSGAPARRFVIAVMLSAWSLRLGTHLFRRIRRHHPQEDTRYQHMREAWSAHFDMRMFGFFLIQALSVMVLALPFLLATRNTSPEGAIVEYAAIALWLAAITGEAVADRQLKAFKHDAANRGRVCRVGLWRYSRHPNYFFEWLIWVAYGLFALAAPWGWLGLLAPALMLYLLLRVSGVPLAEAQSVKSKGEAYRDYQRTTNAFVPWFPRPTKENTPRP